MLAIVLSCDRLCGYASTKLLLRLGKERSKVIRLQAFSKAAPICRW
jgi:hypothetical protein